MTTLRAKLRQGDKSLVSNSAYRRYLTTPDEQHFTIDEARIAEDARYDGLYSLRTNTQMHPLTPMPATATGRGGAIVPFRESSAGDTADLPLYRRGDPRPLVLQLLGAGVAQGLEERLAAARLKPEWRELLGDLDRLQEIEAEQEPGCFILRTPVTGVTGKPFQAVGVALPPNIRDADPTPDPPDRSAALRRSAGDPCTPATS